MAGKGYVAKIAADASGFIRESAKVENSLDAMADALDDIATSTSKTANDSARDMAKIGKEAKQTGKDVEKAFDKAFESGGDKAKDSAKEAEKAYRNMAQKMSQDLEKVQHKQKETASKASQVFEEVGDEMRQNWGETMSSFDGSASSLVDGIADTFGGLAASLGVGGVFGTLFLGSIAGLISNWGQKWIDSFSEIEEKNKQMYEQMAENASGYFSNEQIIENFNKILQGADDAIIDNKTLEEFVSRTEMSSQDIALAFADIHSKQAQELSKKMSDASRKYSSELKNLQSDIKTNMTEGSGRMIDGDTRALKELSDQWGEFTGKIKDNQTEILTNNEYLEKHGYTAKAGAEAARELAAANAEAEKAFDDVTEQIKENIKTEGSIEAAWTQNQAALADYVDQLNAQYDAAQQAGAGSQYLEKLQYDAALSFIEAARQAGKTTAQALELGQAYGLIPKDVATYIREHGTDDAKKKVQNLSKEVRDAPKNLNVNASITYDPGQVARTVNQMKVGIGVLRVPMQPTLIERLGL